jgi:hypothetical protein
VGFLGELIDDLADADEQRSTRSWWFTPLSWYLPWPVDLGLGAVQLGVGLGFLVGGHGYLAVFFGVFGLCLSVFWLGSGVVRHRVKVRQRRRRGRQYRRAAERAAAKKTGRRPSS